MMNIRSAQGVLAVFLILLGVLLLAGNLGFFDADIGAIIGDWWPSILIAIGLWKLAADRGAGATSALVLVAFGAFFLLLTLDVADWSVLWPIVIIAIGAVILFQAFKARRAPAAESVDTVSLTAVFGEAKHRSVSQSFRGGTAAALFGSVDLDLREAHLADRAALSVTVIFGDADITIPRTWQVAVQGTPIFGEIKDKDQVLSEPGAPTLRVNASVLFGDLEIRR